MRIVMMGPPGSGKGTQASKIADYLGIPHISTGDMFREMREEESELGEMLRELMDSGRLIPDDVTAKVVEGRLSRPDAVKGFVLDGYPRNIDQARHLEKLTEVNRAIDIKVSDEEAERRMTSRRVCSGCGRNYNILYVKPQIEGKCDECGGELKQRSDSKPEAVRERLRIYHEKTTPLEVFYRDKGVLVKVNGEQPIQKVFDDIIQRISD